MPEKILLVDDDLNVLAGYSRSLRNDYHVQVTDSGEGALALLRKEGPFAVLVADMRMPGMNGVDLLRHAKEIAPHTVRIMLTGNADVQTSVSAVNDGHIFRFLTKPCPKEVMVKALEAGLEQYHLVMAERELLKGTVNGSIRMMTEVLSLVNPIAFGRASRVRRYVHLLCRKLELSGAWQYEFAAMLSQLGCVTLPAELLTKLSNGSELSAEDRRLLASHPEVGGRLIANIPRLADVGHMVARQNEPFSWDAGDDDDLQHQEPVVVGSQLLHAALDFDALVSHGMQPEAAVEKMRQRAGAYSPAILSALVDIQVMPSGQSVQALPLRRLREQMILEQDVRTKDGKLLVGKGHEITKAVLEHLYQWSERVGIDQPIRVHLPS